MPTDDRTPNLDLPLPHKSNMMEDDVARVRAAFTALDTAVHGKTGAQELANAVAAAVGQAIANLIGDAPANLNTMGELAAAVGGDPSFADNVAAGLAQKLGKDPATATRLGGVKIGSGVNVASDGTISVPAPLQPSAVGQQVYQAADQATARSAIGAGTGNSNFSGAYADLSGKPTTLAAAGITDAATAANPTLTGIIKATGSVRGAKVAVAALDINCASGNHFTKSISANSTFTFSNVPASPERYGMLVELQLIGGVVTWPSGVIWPGGVAPSLSTGKVHMLYFLTSDGGVTWRASGQVNYGG